MKENFDPDICDAIIDILEESDMDVELCALHLAACLRGLVNGDKAHKMIDFIGTCECRERVN